MPPLIGQIVTTAYRDGCYDRLHRAITAAAGPTADTIPCITCGQLLDPLEVSDRFASAKAENALPENVCVFCGAVTCKDNLHCWPPRVHACHFPHGIEDMYSPERITAATNARTVEFLSQENAANRNRTARANAAGARRRPRAPRGTPGRPY
jgi:hypothetical protein